MNFRFRRLITFILAIIIIALGTYGGYKYIQAKRAQIALDKQASAVAEQKKKEEDQKKLEEQKRLEEERKKKEEEQKWMEEQSNLEAKIKEYLGINSSRVGLAYYDIQSGKSFSINGDKYYNAASTVKVPMNMVLFDMVKEGKININSTVKYNSKTDYEGGTGILQSQKLSKPIALQKLSDYSIIYSDNIATRMIIRTIGRSEMKRRFGVKAGHTVPTKNTITPNEQLTFLKQLYENKNNNSYYTRLIDIMKKTEFHDRLDKYVPQDIVAHKIGNYGSYVNDIGIIYSTKPYIIAVYTEGLANANESIANINKMLYEAHK